MASRIALLPVASYSAFMAPKKTRRLTNYDGANALLSRILPLAS